MPPSQRDPFSSFGKKKKKKKPPAPVPPTVPSLPLPVTGELSQSAPHLSLDLEPVYNPDIHDLRAKEQQPLSPIGEGGTPLGEGGTPLRESLSGTPISPLEVTPLSDLVPLELSESPGARRKLSHRLEQNYEELEEAGVEGAPGEMAAYLTDEEVTTSLYYCFVLLNYTHVLLFLLSLKKSSLFTSFVQ